MFPEVKQSLMKEGIAVNSFAELKYQLSVESREFRALKREALETLRILPDSTSKMMQSTTNKWAEQVGNAAVKAHSQIASQAQAVVNILNYPAPRSALGKSRSGIFIPDSLVVIVSLLLY